MGWKGTKQARSPKKPTNPKFLVPRKYAGWVSWRTPVNFRTLSSLHCLKVLLAVFVLFCLLLFYAEPFKKVCFILFVIVLSLTV